MERTLGGSRDIDDGTQVQGISFVPDGSGVLVSLFHAHQQDLWYLQLSDAKLFRRRTPRMWRRTPRSDPMGSPGSPRTLMASTTSTRSTQQAEPSPRRRTCSGEHTASISPGGHLFYTGFTGHGFRIHGVPASDLLNDVVTYPGICRVDGCPDTEAYLAKEPDGVDARAKSERYSSWRASMPVSGWPVMRTTDKNVEAGAGFFLGDYVEALPRG